MAMLRPSPERRQPPRVVTEQSGGEHTMVGVVADDLTGAADVGAMFSQAGCRAVVHIGEAPSLLSATDVMILSTAARTLPPPRAAAVVARATNALQRARCQRFMMKTCSVFRGPVGAMFDAMMDGLSARGARRMIVVSGYPSNNRTTVHGVQYVFDKPLAQSIFRDDPTHPATESNIVEVLRRQTRHRVEHLDLDIVRQGVDAIADALRAMPRGTRYVLPDADSREAMRAIALATIEDVAFGGSAGLAGEASALWFPHARPWTDAGRHSNPRPSGVLIVSGSLSPVTRRQIVRAVERGASRTVLDPIVLLSRDQRSAADAQAEESLREGGTAILCLEDADSRERVARAAAERGSGIGEIGLLLSNALASAAADLVARTGTTRLICCGGDTTSAVCAALGIEGLRIGPPIEPGVPLCGSLGPPLAMVIKGGSMGTEDCLPSAARALRGETGMLP